MGVATCAEPECTRKPGYSVKGEKTGKWCQKHAPTGAFHVNRLCQERDCCQLASCNLPGERKPLFCAQHAQEGAINVVSRRCAAPGCDSLNPCFNVLGQKRGVYCVAHKSSGMIDVTNRKCEVVDCSRQPVFNDIGKKGGRFCQQHKQPKMVNVVDRQCAVTTCEVRCPAYNYPGAKRGEYCRKHALPSMIRVRTVKCAEPSCLTKSPIYNFPGERGKFCAKHAKQGMVNVVSRTCASPWCSKVVMHGKFRGYCLRCFIHLFPDQKISRNYKIKEARVSEFVAQVFQGKSIEITYDRALAGGCSARRPDTFLECYTHGVFEETDETQHDTEAYCSCENKRMMQLFEDAGSRPIVFVRFNPDAYTDCHGVRHPSCFKYHRTSGVPIIRDVKVWEKRLQVLKERLLHHVNTVPDREVTVEHLFYDGFHDV